MSKLGLNVFDVLPSLNPDTGVGMPQGVKTHLPEPCASEGRIEMTVHGILMV